MLKIDAATFRERFATSPVVSRVLLPEMAPRIQTSEAVLRQREKLAALGKLAAGLAHELNNPATAGRWTADQLQETLATLDRLALSLNRRLTAEQLDALAEFGQEARTRLAAAEPLDPLTRSDREDALASWLDERGIEDSWDVAPVLVGAGLDAAWLRTVADRMGT